MKNKFQSSAGLPQVYFLSDADGPNTQKRLHFWGKIYKTAKAVGKETVSFGRKRRGRQVVKKI